MRSEMTRHQEINMKINGRLRGKLWVQLGVLHEGQLGGALWCNLVCNLLYLSDEVE